MIVYAILIYFTHYITLQLYEISLDVLRTELLSSKSVKACLPRQNGIDTELLNKCIGNYHSRVQGNDVLDVGFVKDGMVYIYFIKLLSLMYSFPTFCLYITFVFCLNLFR